MHLLANLNKFIQFQQCFYNILTPSTHNQIMRLQLILVTFLISEVVVGQQLYNHQSSGTSDPSWMSNLNDGIPLKQLSIIGSHSSMSQGTWGDAFQTQSNSLTNQLNMGMRALDIRCRHKNNAFPIYERLINLNSDLQAVLNTVRSFLQTNPQEVVLMHIVEQYNPTGNSRSFEDTYLSYQNNNLDIIWSPTTQNPVLGQTRGKVVIIQDFPANGVHGLLYSTFTVLPHKRYGTNWNQYDKWLDVKNFLSASNSAGSSRISFWTGSVGSFPYFVASGKSSPGNGHPRLATGLTTPGFKKYYPDFPRVACFIGICTIAFEGINTLAYNYINSQNLAYLGIVFTDFVGETILSSSIALNTNRFIPCAATLLTQGCTYCSNLGQCLGCNSTENYIYLPSNFSCGAGSGYYLLWNTPTSNVPDLCSSAIPGCLTCSSGMVCTQCDFLAHYELINDTCEAAPGYYLDFTSTPVLCDLVGCYRCLSATVCQECSIVNNYLINVTQLCECDTGNLFIQHASASACICSPGYFISTNNTCQTIPVCPANNSGCTTCSLTPTPSCSLCDSANNFQTDPINPTLCTCTPGYFFDGLQCLPCDLSLSGSCSSCASQTLCLSCVGNFTLSNGDCSCLPQHYLANATTCLQCMAGCLHCLDGASCQVCDTNNNFTKQAGVCVCQVGMYLNGTNCQVCGSMPGCLDCNTDGCVSCDPVFGFTLNSTLGECQCDYGYHINSMGICQQCTSLGCLDCTSQTVCTVCNVYFDLILDTCSQACGDGFLFELPCDDNNTISGDGCSDTCQVETDYTCIGGTTTSPSACSYSGTFDISVISLIKDPNSNTVYLSVLISPALPQLQALDFNSVWVSNFPTTTSNTTYNPSTGQVSMIFTYDESLNNRDLTVDLVPPATPDYFYMKVSTTHLPTTSTNNLALKAYSQEVYDLAQKQDYIVWTVALLALVCLLLCCLLVSKLMGVQMIFIFQAAYAGLLMITKQQALMVPLRHLKITSAVTDLMKDSSAANIPQRLSQIYYKASFLSNFALSIIIVILPLVVGLIVFIVAKVKQQKKWRLFSYKVFKEWQFSVLLFVQLHLAVSLCLSWFYDDMKAIAMAFGGLIQLALISYLVLLVKRKNNFGEYKAFFKQGTISSNWYILIVIFRTLIGFVMGFLWENQYCTYIVLSLSGIWMVLGAVIRPYLFNVRPIINSAFVFLIFGLLTYSDLNKDSTEVTFLTSYLPLVIIATLIVALLFNIVCMIISKVKVCRQQTQKKMVEQTLAQNDDQSKKIDQDYIQLIKGQLKDSLSPNRNFQSLGDESPNHTRNDLRRQKSKQLMEISQKLPQSILQGEDFI